MSQWINLHQKNPSQKQRREEKIKQKTTQRRNMQGDIRHKPLSKDDDQQWNRTQS